MTGRLSFQVQLLLLTLISLGLLTVFTLGSLRLSTFPAFRAEFRKDLSTVPFEAARRQRCRDLGQTARVFASDAKFIEKLRQLEKREYLDALQAIPKDQLKKAPGKELRQKLATIRTRDFFGLKDMCERMFLSVDNPPNTVKAVPACADLALVVDASGVVLCELSTTSQPGQAALFELDRGTMPEPEELFFFGNPFADAAFVGVDQESNRPVTGYFSYGGHLYQGSALDLSLRTGLIVLADRVDDVMARAAAESCQADVLMVDRQHALLGQSRAGMAELVGQKIVEWRSGQAVLNLNQADWETSLISLDDAPRTAEGELIRPSEKSQPAAWFMVLKPTLALDQVVERQWRLSSLIIGLVTLVAFIVSGLFSAHMGRPVRRLAQALYEVGQGNLEVNLAPSGPVEVRGAALAFNSMVSGLKEKNTLEKLMERLQELRRQADLTDEHVRDQTQFGRFIVVARLGVGGMATVYKALPCDTLAENDRVAIKVIHKQFAADPDYRTRFRREFEILQSLRHPGIVRVLDGGDLNGILYIVMEYVEGTSFRARLERGPLAFDEFQCFAKEILSALQTAHAANVIHRDLKPENIMLTPTGVKILDFGLAAGTAFSRLTQSGAAIGTPSYMAPEQFTGAAPDQSADQYSLGTVFYELLTGRCPFTGPDAAPIIYQQITADPPDPLTFRPDIPPAWCATLKRMLSKKPADRYPDLSQVSFETQASSTSWAARSPDK